MSGNKNKTQNANQQTKGVQKYCNKGLQTVTRNIRKVSGSKKKKNNHQGISLT